MGFNIAGFSQANDQIQPPLKAVGWNAGLAAGWKTTQPRGETAQARCDHSLLPITRQELCGPDRHRRSPAERLNNGPATRAWVTVIDDDMTCAVGM